MSVLPISGPDRIRLGTALTESILVGSRVSDQYPEIPLPPPETETTKRVEHILEQHLELLPKFRNFMVEEGQRPPGSVTSASGSERSVKRRRKGSRKPQ